MITAHGAWIMKHIPTFQQFLYITYMFSLEKIIVQKSSLDAQHLFIYGFHALVS
jgi:hypothetical protein